MYCMTTFYKKEGRKFVPVKEYDDRLMDAYQQGTHLVVSEPGHKITRFNIEPEFAPLIAAGTFAAGKIAEEISRASEYYLSTKPKELTLAQKAAWENLITEFGDSARQITSPSAYDIAASAINKLIEEANKRIQNPEVKKAYEQFLLVYSLAK